MSHPLVALARQALETTIVEGKPFEPPPDVVLAYRKPAPVFVTLRTADGELRGCIGTVTPTTDSLAAQVVAETVSAATRDPRFAAVAPAEVPGLTVEISVLGAPQAVQSIEDLDPERFGVIVVREADGRRALLLPGIPFIKSAAEQVRLARRKAWIADEDAIQLYRFRTETYT